MQIHMELTLQKLAKFLGTISIVGENNGKTSFLGVVKCQKVKFLATIKVVGAILAEFLAFLALFTRRCL